MKIWLAWCGLPIWCFLGYAQTQTGSCVIDHTGKEIKLKSWKFIGGTTHLSWLADRPLPPSKKSKIVAAQGPEALDFREEKSTTFQIGISTLVPIASIRKIDYDNDKKNVAVTVVNAEGKDAVLTGTTKYIGLNKVTLEAEADLGALGVGTVKYQGGNPKGGIRGLVLDGAKPVATALAWPEFKDPRPAVIIAQDQAKHEVADLVPLYKHPTGQLQIMPTLYFKTTVKIDIGKVQKLRHVEPENKKQVSSDYSVTLDDGTMHTLTLLDRNPDDPKGPILVGLLGRVPVGYKLFPPHTISEVHIGKR